MTRRQMTEADWLAVARVFRAIHQRRAAAVASAPAGDQRESAERAGDGDGDG